MLPKISNTAQGMVNIAMGLHKIASKQNIDKISYIYLFKIIMCILFKVLYFCLTKNIYLIKDIVIGSYISRVLLKETYTYVL